MLCENCFAESEYNVNYIRTDENFPDRLKHIAHLHFGAEIRLLAQHGHDVDADDGAVTLCETKLLKIIDDERTSLGSLVEPIYIEHIPAIGINCLGYYSYSDVCGYYWIDTLNQCRRCFRNGNALCIQENDNVPSRRSEVHFYLSKDKARSDTLQSHLDILNTLDSEKTFAVRYPNLKLKITLTFTIGNLVLYIVF